MNAYYQKMRREYEKERQVWNEGGPVVERTVYDQLDGPHGEIPVVWYYPQKTTNDLAPVLLYIHGGGYIVGNLRTHDRLMRELAVAAGCVVVGVDYRLSPEHHYPVALEECVHVFKHLHSQAVEYGIDANRMAIGGDSCGASLALMSQLSLRDSEQAEWNKGLLLYYGSYGLQDSVSIRLLGKAEEGMTRRDMLYYERCYLGKMPRRQARYHDAFTFDLSYGIPDSLMLIGDCDPLLDDNRLLLDYLNKGQAKVELCIYPEAVHTFAQYTATSEVARESISKAGDFLSKLFE